MNGRFHFNFQIAGYSCNSFATHISQRLKLTNGQYGVLKLAHITSTRQLKQNSLIDQVQHL